MLLALATRNLKTRAIALAIGNQGNLPTEFRLFAAGWNDTEIGRFLFDETAAASVMAAYEAWGVDLAIDLEHQMLSEGIAVDPTAKDARGWFKLAMRNGELWAVDVKWAPDGAERLTGKRQRYISPAFEVDRETQRVSKIYNVAITAMPATHHTPALVAASASGAAMSVEEFIKVCKALGIDMAGSLEDAMAKIKGEKPAEEPAAEEPAAEAAAPAPEAPAPASPAEDDKPEEVAAALSSVLRLSGKASFVAASADVAVWHASHLELETERVKLAAERKTLEGAERRKGCVDLVTLGGCSPATVWATPDAKAPKGYLASMSIADFREYVADAIKANAGKPVTPKAPTADAPSAGDRVFETPHGSVTLSAREIAGCTSAKADPAVYAANKAYQIAERAKKGSK